MSVQRLPSGRWRAQVHVAGTGNISVSRILGPPGTFPTKREAQRARERARIHLETNALSATTIAVFWQRWTTDPLFRRPKASTNIHNCERTKAFVERYGTLQLDQVGDQIVAEWLAGGNRNGTVPALRAMFNDARSAKAGRLVDRNPFAELGISRGPGRRHQTPPSEQVVRELVAAADRLAGPSLAAWLQVACFTGTRPGELDALRWANVDLEGGWIHVVEQYSSTSRTFTPPKNGLPRRAPLTPPAREALLRLPQDSGFCFTNFRGSHWTAPGRAYHWKAVKAAVGYTGSLYLATRHFAGSYMRNVLDIPAEDVAIALGHTDGGILVAKLYGHRETQAALDRVKAAYSNRANVRPIPRRKETA